MTKLTVGATYTTTDHRKVKLVADHGDVVERWVDGEDAPQPMRRDLFEVWVARATKKKAR